MRKKPKKRKIRIYDIGLGKDQIRLDSLMGYTFDTKVKIPATANTTTSANPATGTITIADDADLLVVSMIYGGNVARTGGAPTANGVTLTQADTARTVTEAVAELWYLTTPQSGNNVIVVPNAGTAKALDIFVSSFKAQSGYGSSFNSASGTATTAANPSITVRVPGTQSVVVSVCGNGVNAWGPTVQSGTVIYNDDPSTWGGGAQYILNPPVGAVISSWTVASDDWGLVAAAFVEQQTLKSISDAGSGTDAITASNTTPTVKSVDDTGQGNDTESEVISLSLLDASQGIDDTSQSVSLSVVDSGVGADTLTRSPARYIAQTFAYIEYLSDLRQIAQTFAYIEYIEVEHLYPVSDLENPSAWQNEFGSSILYPSIDDPDAPNDSDYVWSNNAQVNDYFEVKLTNPSYLFDGGDVTIQWRGSNRNAGVNTTVKVELREGTIVRASNEKTLSDFPITYEYVLTPAEIASIVNIDILSLRFTVTGIS